MKKIFLTTIALLFTTLAFGQAKKPKLMVVPSDAWCSEHGFTQTFDNQGTSEVVSDYKVALRSNKDLNNVISKINILMADRGFPLQDLQQTIKSIATITTENSLIKSKDSGVSIAESPLDQLRRIAKADIILEVDWTINENDPKKSITYNLKGIDAYTNKQIAGVQGTGYPSFSAEIPQLLEEAVLSNMDNFTSQLQNHFDDLLTNGREVVIDVNVFDNGSGLDFEKEYNGIELSEILDNWMADNTVNHRFSTSEATQNHMLYEQVRIPIYKQNGMPQDTYGFTRELMKFLRGAPYNITSKIINRGLGRCLLIIGEK